MELRQIAGGSCNNDDCPAVFLTEKGTIAVQGLIVDRQTPGGEGIVEIPTELLREAAGALGW